MRAERRFLPPSQDRRGHTGKFISRVIKVNKEWRDVEPPTEQPSETVQPSNPTDVADLNEYREKSFLLVPVKGPVGTSNTMLEHAYKAVMDKVLFSSVDIPVRPRQLS